MHDSHIQPCPVTATLEEGFSTLERPKISPSETEAVASSKADPNRSAQPSPGESLQGMVFKPSHLRVVTCPNAQQLSH